MKYYFRLAFCLILLSGCDCVQLARARVFDGKDKTPIVSVLVFKERRPSQKAFTDSKSSFEIRSITGGRGPCPPMTIVLNKTGYQARTIELTSDTG